MSDLSLYQLAPSPNTIKVRLALGLKKIPCELLDVNPMDRAQVVELSGQPLTPVLKHGDRVVYDSYGILRYLDANWPDEPRLFSPDRAKQQEIEHWELFARTQIGATIGMIFGQAFADAVDPAVIKEANDLLAERCPKIEDALASQDYVMGSAPNAADLTLAPFVACAMVPEGQPEGSIMGFFAQHFRLPKDFAKTYAWAGRVMAFDCAKG